jgi:peptidoglycan/xylan/chitin deacetylase (PgdA/CDA1 family)
MSITRGQFLRSLGKSLPGMMASTGVATAAQALMRRVAQSIPPEEAVMASKVAAKPPVAYLQKGPETGNAIALTFDDGPEPGVTEHILDTLQAHSLRATFFMIGEKVAASPELARRVAEGHEIGHHTYTHRKLTELTDAEVEQELEKTDAIFMEVLGRRADWFRPPFGLLRQDQAARVQARGMRVALWSLDSEDWRGEPGPVVTERILTHTHPGAIVLCHDVATTADSLAATLCRLRDTQPWRAVTLTELVSPSAHAALR